MAPDTSAPHEQVVIGEEVNHVRLITLNQPRRLNVISSKVPSLLAEYLEKWEKDEDAELIIFKGAGRAFSAGGDLKIFYDERDSYDSCLHIVYRMYWLCYHNHTYKKTQVSLAHGITMGGGASLMVPMKFSVVSEKTVFSMPEASIGFHTDCSFSYIFSRLPGHMGEYLALTGARLHGKELVAAGLATHFVPAEACMKLYIVDGVNHQATLRIEEQSRNKFTELESRLIELNSGDEHAVRSVIEKFSSAISLEEGSILHKQAIIDKCFSKESVKEIIQSFEAEASKEGNDWILAVLKGLKRSAPTGLKMTLRSVREGRKQTLSECLKKEFRLTINTLRKTISEDIYEGIRALIIDKDNSPKWSPPTLDELDDEKVNLLFQPFEEEFELHIPDTEANRWDGKYENSGYQCLRAENNPDH